MDKDLSTLISLVSAIVSLASFFGLFYKMKYQLEQLEKKQSDFLESLSDLVHLTYENRDDITALKIHQQEMKETLHELKGASDGKEARQYGTRSS